MIGTSLSVVRTASPSHQSNGRMHLTKKQGDYAMLTKFCKGFAMGCVHILFILFQTKGLIIVNCSQLTSSLFEQGVEASIRAEVWPFLLNLYGISLTLKSFLFLG